MADQYHIDFGIWGSIFPVPCAVADQHLKLCTGKQLKVLLLALRDAPAPVDLAQIARRLGIPPEEAADCLDYWRQAGLFTTTEAPPAPAPAAEQTAQPAAPPPAAPPPSPIPLREEQTVAGQRITTLHSRAKLTPSQQNRLIRENPEIPPFLQLLQEVLGRPLTPYETEGFLYLHSGLRLPADYLLMAVQYSRDTGRDSIRQVERLVTGWVEKGVDTLEKAEAEIQRLVRCHGNEGIVREIFGIRDRALSAKEKRYIEGWFDELGYDAPIIRLAYDRTVDNTGKAAFPYLDKILRRWREKGVETPEQAAAEMESGRRPAPPKAGTGLSPESSFDLTEVRRLMEQNSGGE